MNRWVNASGHVLFALAVLMIAGLGQISAQTTVSADGVIESTVGGFKFPDGSMQATAAAGGAPVEDTGQTGCWDTDGVSRPCAGTGEDGELLAGVAWPTSRFTDNGDGTATDNLTGLIWLKDANCPAGGMTWQLALDWVHDLNTESTACTDYSALTFTDWRLPNIRELLSLVDYSQATPPLPFGHPFVNVLGAFYWSSSSAAPLLPDFAWVVAMDMPGTGFKSKTSGTVSDYLVWPVRGGQ